MRSFLIRAALVAAFFVALVPSAWAQGAMQQGGAVSAPHLSMYLANGQLGDAGGPMQANGPPVNSAQVGTRPAGIGFVNSGLSNCAWSGYANLPYTQLCFGFDGSGNGLIALDRFGGGLTPVLTCRINGSTGPCLGGGAGMAADASNALLPIARYNLGPNNACNPVTDPPVGTPRADPLGAPDSDSSAAINYCAGVMQNGQKVNIYLPGGSYLIKKALHISGGQCLYGDAVGITNLLIQDSFDAAATGVILPAGLEQFAPCMDGFDMLFQQPGTQGSRAAFQTLGNHCTSAGGGTGCKYPPAIFVPDGTPAVANRIIINNIRIGGAWDGIHLGNAGGAMLSNIQCGALNVGLYMDRAFDFPHVTNWHTWDFGFPGQLLNVWRDGQVTAALLKFVDGMNINGFVSYHGNLVFDQSADGAPFGTISNLEIDEAKLNVIASNAVTITGGYIAAANNATDDAITVAGGRTYISNMFLGASVGGKVVTQTGGKLYINGGTISHVNNTNVKTIDVSGSDIDFTLKSTIINAGAYNDGVTPVISEASDSLSTIAISGVTFGSTNTTNPGIVISADGSKKSITATTLNGFSVSLPAISSVLGYYDLDYDFPITVTPTFSTMGNFAPTSNTVLGSYTYRGDYMSFQFRDTFSTNTPYSGVNGTFSLQTNMPQLKENDQACSYRFIDNAVFTSTPLCGLSTGTSFTSIVPQTITSGAAHTGWTTANIPAGTANILIGGNGQFRIR